MSAPELVGPALKSRPVNTPRHLRLVGVEELAAVRRRRRMRLAGMALAGFVIALLFAAVGMHVVLAQNQFRLDRLDNQAALQQARYQQLRLQYDQLSSPQRIIGTAEGRLGMVPPAQVTFLDPSSATQPSGVAAAAAGAGGTAQAAGGPAPATAPPNWSTVKPQLAAHQ
jgi:cell division protein FtsL